VDQGGKNMNETGLQLVIATEKSRTKILPGGTPVFLTADEAEQQKLATTLSRILQAAVHDLENGLLILVKH